MKRYLFTLLVGSICLTSCGDDDKPIIPELNSVTRISCFEGESDSPKFTLTVDYTNDGRVSNMHYSGDDEWRLISSDNKYLTLDISSGETLEEYILNGNVIIEKNVSKKNKYASNEVYISDEYRYAYSGSELVQTSWVTRWPDEKGGYKSESYAEYDKFKWENGNVTVFSRNQDRMEYEYRVEPMPQNFPLRVIGSLEPVGLEVVSPLNLMFGRHGKNLPIKAYSYTIPNMSEKNAEYIYSYTTVGDYITEMTINETKGNERNTYKYTFEYNFSRN